MIEKKVFKKLLKRNNINDFVKTADESVKTCSGCFVFLYLNINLVNEKNIHKTQNVSSYYVL